MIGYERHYYELEGSKILSEIIFDINGNKSRLDYNYDINGELVSVEYLGYKYFYIKDALGNINYVVDETGSIMVKYSYDEWGVPTKTIVQPSCPIGVLNPFMYKSYYFDNDTEMYYLNSRFYHPSLRRFITMDDVNYLDKLNVSNLNLYNYSKNNPIMYYDPSGHSALLVILVVFIVDAIVETCILMNNDKYQAESVYKDGSVSISDSAYFNNPIAQYIYSSYLYNNVKKEDESNYFEGNRFDIMGKWQAHNAAYWGMKVVSLFSKDFANSLAAKVGSENYEIFLDSAKTVHLGGTIDADGRDIVELISSILSDINEKYFGLIERTIYILCNINF